MRACCISLALWLLAGAAFLTGSSVRAGEEKKADPKQVKIEGQLTKDDPKDKIQTNSFHKVHTVKMAAGKTYRIDLTSRDFDTFLRLEDPTGKELASDDDGGEGLNSRIIHKAEKDGNYRLIVTSFPPEKTGTYTLIVKEAGAGDLLETKVKNIFKADPEERKQIIADFAKHLGVQKEKIIMSDVRLAFRLAQAMEFSAKEEAPRTYATFGKLLSASADKKVASLGKTFEGAARRLSLPGKEMVVKGTNLEGKPLDLKTYRGKVVLVDFWATWCGPCIRELPNVKKLYGTYHDRGFDVVGISLDFNKDALLKFIDREKLPWVSIYDKTAGNEVAEYYGIFSIPLPILVDKEGRVISMDARGPELARLLEKYLGPPDKKDKSDK